uniref:Tim44-like domain-containing protein n=1 Tax=Electrophorus electricus TaxID=8005 RepID=A0A4W4HFC6_ELEEL
MTSVTPPFLHSITTPPGEAKECVDSLKQELNNNNEMKENAQTFREEARRMEESEALQQARRKHTSEVLKKTQKSLSETVKEVCAEEEAAKTARSTVQSVSMSGEALGRSTTVRSTTRAVLHKASQWCQQWKDFIYNNVVFNRLFEMKMKYDESDNACIRALTDKATDLMGGLFSETEMSEGLTEILSADPTFDKHANSTGLQFHYKVLDIDSTDIMEQGPVLIITFQARVVMVIRSAKGEVVDGDLVSISKTLVVLEYQEGLNPHAAWKLLGISASSTEQAVFKMRAHTHTHTHKHPLFTPFT